MRTSFPDANVRRYDDNAPLTNCPNCNTFMVPLANHELSAGEHPTLEAEGLEYFVFGLWAYLYNLLFGAAALATRKRKLAKLKNEVLPQSPNALICPACLQLKR